MWLNLVFAGVLALFAAMGARRGGWATGLGLATLVLSYVAALALGPAFAPALGERGLAPVVALAVACSGTFVASYVVLGLLSKLARRLLDGGGATRSPRDRFLGGCFGALRGTLVALLVGYLALWIDAARVAVEMPAWLPAASDSAAARLTGDVVESGLQAALGDDDPAARVAARIAARPAVAAVEFERVIENPNVEALRGDAMFWTYVEHGSIDTALDRVSFQKLSRDAELRRQLGALGLVAPEAVDDDDAFRDEIAAVMREVGPRIRGLRDDPELEALLADPQVVAMLQDGNALGLLSHPGFRRVVDRVTSRPQPE